MKFWFLILVLTANALAANESLLSPASLQLAKNICYKMAQGQKNKLHNEELAGAFQARRKVSSAIKKELRPFSRDLDAIYQKGAEMREMEARFMELNKVQYPKKEVIDEMHDLDMKATFLSSEMTGINNAFVTKVQQIYKKNGFPAILVADEKGVLNMQLDFSKAPTDKKAFEFYRNVSRRFGVDKITMSLKENAQKSFKGYFNGSESRIEMGPDQAISLLQDYINTTGKHESRHAMFFARRNRGVPSVFHAQFHAQGEKLLNDAGMYERYMSAEEIYTFSTDLQTLAQAFHGEFLTDLSLQRSLIEQITEKAEGLGVISDATVDFSGSFIKSLTDQLSGKKPFDIEIVPQTNGSLEIQVTDDFERIATIDLVSKKEKSAFLKFQKFQEKRNLEMDKEFQKVLAEKGIDPSVYFKKMQDDKLTLPEKALMSIFTENFEKSAISLKMKEEALGPIKEIIITSKKRMEKIQKVAAFQAREVETLRGLLKEAEKNPTPLNIQILKNQMFRIAKNVKEDYKGFILKN